jgi:phosphatidylglycerophosphate synthase
MLDRWTLKWITPGLKKTADLIGKTPVSADVVTLTGFLVGILAVPALWQEMYSAALAIILLNRILDGVDGTLARMRGPTDAGGFLDITLDFIFYSAVILGFALARPEQNGLAAVTLILSFVGTGTSFLAFAVMAAKHNIKSVQYPQKSLYYLGGLTEGTETILIFVAFCLFPDHFPILAYTFAALCGLTTILRIHAGYHTLKSHSTDEEKPA